MPIRSTIKVMMYLSRWVTKPIKMKKTLNLLSLAVVLLLSGSSFAQDKLGHVNYQGIIDKMPETEAAMLELQNYEQELMSVLEDKQIEYQTKINRLQTDTTLSLTVQQDLYDELLALEQRIMQFEQNAQMELAQKESDLIAPIIDKINGAINSVAEEGGYIYIFDAQVLHYANGTDVTPLVEAKLGISQ